jgi:hypothetical protein
MRPPTKEVAAMVRMFGLAIACCMALAPVAEGAPRGKGSSPERAQSARQRPPEQDEFRSCDVAVRDFVQGRKEATALPVKDVEVDGLRMTLNFVHPYGKSGDTPPNLAFTRGESIEERRKALNETKERIRTLVDAAKSGNLWYVIALSRDKADDARRSAVSAPSDGVPPSASAVVMASIESKCITVSEYKVVDIGSLSDDLRRLLGEQGLEPPPVTGSLPVPGPARESSAPISSVCPDPSGCPEDNQARIQAPSGP